MDTRCWTVSRGLYCVNVGYGRQEIIDAIARQGRDLAYYHVFAGNTNAPTVKLSERILAMAPAGMARVFYGLSGSDANDTQFKIVRYYNNILDRPAKKKVISRLGAYHGSGVVSGSMTGMPLWHDHFDLPLPDILHAEAPYYYANAKPGESEVDYALACAQRLESMILREGPETIAAFIAEPVMGTGGLVPPPAGYWAAVQTILRKHDILLIADEVVSGFGRLGTAFGCDYYDIEPDLMTVAKGLSSAYLPISGVIVGQKVWNVLIEGGELHGVFGHGTTYGGHPMCAAAANSNLDIIEREGLIERVADISPYFQRRMKETLGDHRLVGDVRGVGLLSGVELSTDKDRRRPFSPEAKPHLRASGHARRMGIIARAMPAGQILGFAPPFIIEREEIDRLADVTRAALDKTLDELSSEGLFA